MGTRATTVIRNEEGDVILTMYRQMDGYFNGHGREIVDFISKGKLVNGFSFGSKFGEVFNGMGDLACQLVAHLKRPKTDYGSRAKKPRKIQSVGMHYITAPIKKGQEEEFHYELSCNAKMELMLKCKGHETDDDDNDIVTPDKWTQLFPLTELSKKLLGLDKPSIND